MNNEIIIQKQCKICKRIYALTVPMDAWKEFTTNPNNRNIQNILPMLTADERELLISGICGPCFDKCFPPTDSTF